MSISTQLTRLTSSRDKIREKLVELGLASGTATLDTLATVIKDIADQGAVDVEIVEGQSYTIPAGYHNGSGVVKALTDTSGEAEKYKTQAKTITPTKNQQSVTPDQGYYALGSVTVAPIPDAYQNVSSVTAAAGDVLAGKVFVTSDGTVVTGTMVNNGAVTGTLSGTVVSYTIPKGYHNGSGEVTITLENKTVTPSKAEQTISASANKVLGTVTVNPIPSNYADVSDANADNGSLSAAILVGTAVYAKDESGNAVKVEGTMEYRGAVNETVGVHKDYTIPQGYHSGNGKVSIVTQTCKVTPSENYQSFTPDDGEVFTYVSVDPIPGNYTDASGTSIETYTNSNGTVLSSQLLSGVTAVGKYYNEAEDLWTSRVVTGSMADNDKVTRTLSTTSTYFAIPEGYHPSGGKVDIVLEDKTIDCPTDNTKVTEITPTAGKVLSKVTINPLPKSYADTSDATLNEARAGTILAGEVVYGYDTSSEKAVKIEGTMVNHGKKTETIDGVNTTSYTIPGGLHNGMGTVTFDESAIAALLADI